jgi:hypothetical protein
MSKNTRYHERYYAVLRVDLFKAPIVDLHGLSQSVVVKEIVPDEATAKREVDRLNRAKRGESSMYFYQIARVFKRDPEAVS